jgi:glycogen synthase
MTKKICMFVTNPVTNDPRVRREADTLLKAGYQVVVIGLKSQESSREEWINGCHIIRVPHPRGFGIPKPQALLLLCLKRVFPRFYESLRAYYRGVRPDCKQGASRDNPALQADALAPSPSPTFFSKFRTDVLAIINMIWLNVALVSEAVKQRADIYHAHDLDTLLAGFLAKRATGKKLVYDFHELYTEQFEKGVKTGVWRLYYLGLEWFLAKRTDLRLTVCDSLGEWLSRRYGVNGVITVMNVPSSQDFLPIRVSENRSKVILYHGVYRPDRGLEGLIESARYLEGGRIVLRGYGCLEDQLRDLVKEKRVEDRVSFASPVPMTDLVRAASEAEIGVIPYIPVCLNNRFCLPNKIFEYMMAGLALAGSDLPELRRIIMGYNLGGVFNPEEPQDIARALNELLADDAALEKMRRNALDASMTVFNWDIEGQKLLRLYDSAFHLDLPEEGS